MLLVMPSAQELAQDLAGRDAGGLGEGADGAGQFDDDLSFPRGGGIGALALDVGPPRTEPPDRLVVLAAARVWRWRTACASTAAVRGRPRCSAASSSSPAVPRVAGRAAGVPCRWEAPAVPGGPRPPGPCANALLGRQVVALLLLFVLADVLGERLGARLAGADGVGRQADVRLLRRRLLRLGCARASSRASAAGPDANGGRRPSRRASSRPASFRPACASGRACPGSFQAAAASRARGRCGANGGMRPGGRRRGGLRTRRARKRRLGRDCQPGWLQRRRHRRRRDRCRGRLGCDGRRCDGSMAAVAAGTSVLDGDLGLEQAAASSTFFRTSGGLSCFDGQDGHLAPGRVPAGAM